MSTPDSSLMKNTAGGIIRAVAGEIPIVGAFVNAGGAVVDARQRERDEEFFAMLAARVTLTQEQLDEIKRGDNDVFVATANRVIREARETADHARMSMLANVLANTAAMASMSEELRESLISIVLSLSPMQAIVLDYFAKPSEWMRRNHVPARQYRAGETRDSILVEALADRMGEDINSLSVLVRLAGDDLVRRELLSGQMRVAVAPGSDPKSRITELGTRELNIVRGAN